MTVSKEGQVRFNLIGTNPNREWLGNIAVPGVLARPDPIYLLSALEGRSMDAILASCRRREPNRPKLSYLQSMLRQTSQPQRNLCSGTGTLRTAASCEGKKCKNSTALFVGVVARFPCLQWTATELGPCDTHQHLPPHHKLQLSRVSSRF